MAQPRSLGENPLAPVPAGAPARPAATDARGLTTRAPWTPLALALEVTRLARQERHATAQLVAALAEFDARRLYLPAGCASLFTYCTEVLQLSEHAAYHRIEAARAARRHPELLDRLAAGDLTLTTVTRLAPHLTAANAQDLLSRARHQSKREVERLVAELRPQADVPASVRKLPAPPHASRPAAATPAVATAQVPYMSLLGSASTPCSPCEPATVDAAAPHAAAVAMRPDVLATGEPPAPEGFGQPAAPPQPAVIAPLAPERYKVQFTISRETHDRLRRAQDLLRHVVPDGDPAQIVDRALARLVTELEKRKLAAVRRPRPGGREHARDGSGDVQLREAPAVPGAVRGAVAPHSRPGAPPGLGSRRRTLRLCRHRRSLHGAGPARVPSSRPVRGRRGDNRREPGTAMPAAQPARGGTLVWTGDVTHMCPGRSLCVASCETGRFLGATLAEPARGGDCVRDIQIREAGEGCTPQPLGSIPASLGGRLKTGDLWTGHKRQCL